MKVIEVQRRIEANPDDVWATISDADRLVGANAGVLRIDGEIAAGSRFKLWSMAAPKRAFPIKVTAFEPNRRMVWEGGMPFGLFRGVREFLVSDQDGGASFHMRETYSGLLLDLIWKSMPNLQPSFDTFGDGVKTAAEARGA